MKRIKDKPYAGLQWIFLIELISYFVVSKYQISTTSLIVILLFIAIVYFFSLVPTHYSFEFDSFSLVIKNSWNPFYFRKYELKSIDKIEITNNAYMGIGVKIHLDSGKKKVYNINNKRIKLEEMVKEIEANKNQLRSA